jgi:signal transduction histidine kinase/DNA-binding response OmpR family regulator
MILLAPLGFFLFSYQYVLGAVDAQAELSARTISGVIIANPKTWVFEQVRLSELLERRPLTTAPQARRIFDAGGALVAESAAALPRPTVTRHHLVHDAGDAAGRIEITQSLRPIVTRTAVLELVALLAGSLLVVAVRMVPLRAIENAERTTAESERRYRALYESMREGVAVFRLDGAPARLSLVNANPSWQAMHAGGSGAEVLDGALAGHLPDIERGAGSGRSFAFEASLPDQPRAFSLSVFYPEPGLVAFVAEDQTEAREAVRAREQLQRRMLQAQKMESLGLLAGGIAHDFNNLTAIVLGYGEMLLGELRPEDPLRNCAAQIVEAGRRSAAVTRQLLAFSRKQAMAPEVLDLNALIRNFERMLGRLIGEDVELNLKLADDPGRVKADPGQIEQIITNLALNARDAMPRGGRLTVETAAVELDETYPLGQARIVPGRYVLLALTDTGCGMDAATMARLFEPFFTTKSMSNGTGLGLATAYGIVKQSGGYIQACSEPGAGTTFKIFLPRTDAALAAQAAKPGGVGGETPRGSGESILLVEDEAPLRELCGSVLSKLGYRVSAAGNGGEALLLVGHGLEPDLVLTDVVMPGMNGAELIARLRRDRPGLRVLYMSGYPDDAIFSRGVLDPEVPLVQKPFTERVLAARVREALDRNAAARPGGHILMIDDDEQYRDLTRRFCTKGGYSFAGVDSSAAALTALAAQPCDVLLVDMNIPGTSGERVLREVRAAGHAAPAIVLTGDLASADSDAMRPLGVVRTMEKSGNPAPLLRAIAAAVAAGPPRPA